MQEFIKYFIVRVKRDEIGINAASLSFTSILALIPALTIALSIFTMVPAFDSIKEELTNFVKANFVPVFSDAVAKHIEFFVAKAASLTLTSTLFLIVVSLMLIRAIDKSINKIWRGGKRTLSQTFAIYWTLLTVGPLALGVLLWLGSTFVAQTLQYKEIATFTKYIFIYFPIFIEVAILTTIYMVVPVTSVKLVDATLGAVVTTIAFEITKKVFATFIISFSDYEAIYGTLAALPVFMMWIYINWWLVLLGTLLTSLLHSARIGNQDELPAFISVIASVTGSTLGSDSAIKIQKKKTLNIKVDK